jgi:uncharacterized protein YjhX (UPF0386 family)
MIMRSAESTDVFMSAEDTQSIKVSIKELESELWDALERLEQAKLHVDNLTKALEERRALIAPIRKLPTELLSEIFVFASCIKDLAPVKITAVSRRWHDIILATPQAWSRIWLDNDLTPEKSHRYISTFLKYSDPIPLHVRLPEEFDPSYDVTGFSLHSNLFENMHRIQCMTASSWQIAHSTLAVFPNLTQMSFTKADGGFKPSNISIANFPRLEAIDSLSISWRSFSTSSRNLFPPLQRLSISVDRNSAWMEIIQCCFLSLTALIVWGRQDYDTSQAFSVDLPTLKSLEILDFPYNTPWSTRVTTPSLVSYKETRIHADSISLHHAAIGSHIDVGTVTHLRTDIVPDLSYYPALQVLGLQISPRSASLLYHQFTNNIQLCPSLRHIEFILFDPLSPVGKAEFEKGILQKIKETREHVTVTFMDERVFAMPFDLINTLVGNAQTSAS